MDIAAIPNQPERALSLAVPHCVCSATTPIGNPYDEFSGALRDFVLRAAKAESEQDSLLIHLIMLGLISQTEVYFRAVLSNVILLCPLCAGKVTGDTISYAAAAYYADGSLGFALLEHQSLADFEHIAKQTKRLTDFNIAPTSSVGAALLEFNKVCAIRHAVIHSGGILSAANLIELDHTRKTVCSVKLSFQSFEEIADICFNAVKAFNRFLFNAILDRWVKQRLLTDQWSASKQIFEPLYRVFVAKEVRDELRSPRRAFTLIALPRLRNGDA